MSEPVSVQEALERVLELQGWWSGDGTPEMIERGSLVRAFLPARLQEWATGLQVAGSDGFGRKTRVPWVRIFDPQYSPKATQGWYVVYLFAADGSACYLSLNQGTTENVRGKIRPRHAERVADRSAIAREHLREPTRPHVVQIELVDPGVLGRGYERGNVWAVRYEAGNVPSDRRLRADVSELLDLLSSCYRLEDSGLFARNAETPRRVAIARPSIRRPADVIEWVRSEAGPEMVPSRAEAEQAARRLLDARAGHMTIDDATQLGSLLNQGVWGGVKRRSRFTPAFIGAVLERLIQPLEPYNDLTQRLCNSYIVDALVAMDEILRHPEALPGAGRSYPSVLLYLRDPERFAIWLQATHRGLAALTEFDEPISRLAGVDRYERYCDAVQRFRARYHLEPQEVDAVLAAAARLAIEEEAAAVAENEELILEATAPAEPSVSDATEYSLEDVSAAGTLDAAMFEEWADLLRGRKRQALFYGPPGTGKTFLARLLAAHLCSGLGTWEMTQFHPSYTYEHFIEGLRAVPSGQTIEYAPEAGKFVKFCKRAEGQPGTFVFIIDELNRAEVGSVLGELMFLLEYRGSELTLPYSGKEFSVPENVVVLATMNTADRSLALVDFALRRRFHQFEVAPDRRVLEQYLDNRTVDSETALAFYDLVQRAVAEKDFAPGHAYWMIDDLTVGGLLRMWRYNLKPYLTEYWFDNPRLLVDLDRDVEVLLAVEA